LLLLSEISGDPAVKRGKRVRYSRPCNFFNSVRIVEEVVPLDSSRRGLRNGIVIVVVLSKLRWWLIDLCRGPSGRVCFGYYYSSFLRAYAV
jgi:hypothetical protein